MNEEVTGILVGHGKLAEGLLDAVEGITGTREGIVAVDNVGLTPEALEARLQELAGSGPALVFVDLPSGSCAFAARRLKLQRTDMAVVCGVNLPLLLDFVFHRGLPLNEVVERLRSRVGVSIEYTTDADSSVSG
jgi:mannose/fructose-specific phosphotransferase system component IIA